MTIRVPLREQRDASYDIVVGAGVIAQLPALLREHCPAAGYAVVTDAHVGKLYGDQVLKAVSGTGSRAELLTFPAGEWNKTRETWASLSDRMLASHFGRDCAVIALGGGVVGDVAGFVAATYLRGVPHVQLPTSLLAMIDSSIGGKTGVDVPAGKNLLGAFHQPRLVLADLDLLASLPPVQLSAGLAEAVKHGVIADAEYFGFLERDYAPILTKDGAALEQVVRRSVEIKAEVVAEDERESSRRAILNFGHTIGHAIEATSKYEVLHGEAVAIGMAYEARLGEALGVTTKGTAERIVRLLEQLRLPIERPDGASVDQVIEVMRGDKKVRGGEIRFAVPKEIGVMDGGPSRGYTAAVDMNAIRDILSAA